MSTNQKDKEPTFTKVEELEGLNQSLRQRDKINDDAIAQLSDQLMSLSDRLHEIERWQA